MADLASLGRKQFSIYDTWPARLGMSLLSALALPHDVASGHFVTTPAAPGTWSEEDEARAQMNRDELSRRTLDLAGIIGSGGTLGAARRLPPRVLGRSEVADHAVIQRAKLPPSFDPPVMPQRPFEADYLLGAGTNQSEKLRADIEGRRLIADYIAGRRTAGGVDQALSPAEIDAVATKLLGAPPKELPVRDMGGNFGFQIVDRAQDRRGIGVLKTHPPELKSRIKAHEVGHLVDDLGGATIGYDEFGPLRAIGQQGLGDELRNVYHTLKTGKEAKSPFFGPEQRGYEGADVASELMAEAIRAYLTNPNYLKTVAPKTAAAIRMHVNVNPTLARTLQFNTLAGAGLTGAALANSGIGGAERPEGLDGDDRETW